MTTSASGTVTTAYYRGVALSINGAISYTLNDPVLGSVSASVPTTSGQVSASQLYSPYGGVRYTSGTLPTDYGFTHQRSDATTSGLDDYGARFYDPVAGQFTSADTTLAGGLNRYAYVGGNPETFVDPSGHALREGITGEGGGLPGGEGTPGGGDTGGDAWGASGDPTGSTSSLSPSMTVGDELTYDAGSAGADSFHVDASGGVDGVTGPDGQVLESNAQIAAQAHADAQDRLNKGQPLTSQDGQSGAATTSPTTTGLHGFPEDQQQPYVPTGKTYGQEYPGSCVAACGRMILNDAGATYYDGAMPESVVRQAAGVDTKAGGNISTLESAVPQLGGPTGQYVNNGSLDDLQQATSGGTSAVAAIDVPKYGLHAIVVDGVTSGVNPQVLIRDPADGGGAYSVSTSDFLQIWTGRFTRFGP